MKKKTIIFSIICIFIVTAFSGCTKQNAITNSKFEEKAKEKGFTVGDATAQYEMELNSFLKTIKNYDMTTTPQVITKLNEYYTLIQKRIDVISYWLNESMKGIC